MSPRTSAIWPPPCQRKCRWRSCAGQSLAPSEPLVQFTLRMRQSLRRELDRLAVENDTDHAGLVLSALKDKGLSVTDDDLLDLRKQAD